MYSAPGNDNQQHMTEDLEKREHQSKSELAVWISNLSAAYRGQPPVLEDINLELPAGKLIVIVGPNGAGKSTLFSLITGIKAPLTGEIKVFGQSLARQRHRNIIAYVPQQEDIDWDYPIPVRDVVLGGRYGYMKQAAGLRRFLPPAWAGEEHHQAVKEALRSVEMLSYSSRPIGSLSGGQKKRVFLARALAQDAQLQLLDEPLVGVDGSSEEMILEVLKECRDRGRTILMVTHDLKGAENFADLMILLNRRVIAAGSPREVMDSMQNPDWRLKEGLLQRVSAEAAI